MNGTEFTDDNCAPIPVWAKDHPKTWLTYMTVDYILWADHQIPEIQRIFQESKLFFNDYTLLEDPLSKGFPIPDLLKRLRERAQIADLDGRGPYYMVELTPCSRTLMCDACCNRIENPIGDHPSIWFSPFTQDLRCAPCVNIVDAPWVRYPNRDRTHSWLRTMTFDRQSEPLSDWKLHNPKTWMKFFVFEHLLWYHHQSHAAEICDAFYKNPTMFNRPPTVPGISQLCRAKIGKTRDQIMHTYAHPFSRSRIEAFKIQLAGPAKQLRCDRCLEILKTSTVTLTNDLWLYCRNCLPLKAPMVFYPYDDEPKVAQTYPEQHTPQKLCDKTIQQIAHDRILAEVLQKEFDNSEPALASPIPPPSPLPLPAAPSPHPNPLPASSNGPATIIKTIDEHERSAKLNVLLRLQSTVVRSETLITGAFAGPRWFAFKMYEHASLLISTSRPVQDIEEEWKSWPVYTLVLMRAVYELLGKASVQLPLPFQLPSGEFQRCILIQNQTQRVYCSQEHCARGLISIGELVYVSVLDLETFCFLCGPPYKDGHTIIYHPSRLLSSKSQQPPIQQSLARLAIQDDSSLSAPKRQKSSEGDETESNTSPRDHMEVSEPDGNTCVICLEEKATWASVPCGHMHYCGDCIKLITKCASCRASIQMKVRIYNS